MFLLLFLRFTEERSFSESRCCNTFYITDPFASPQPIASFGKFFKIHVVGSHFRISGEHPHRSPAIVVPTGLSYPHWIGLWSKTVQILTPSGYWYWVRKRISIISLVHFLLNAHMHVSCIKLWPFSVYVKHRLLFLVTKGINIFFIDFFSIFYTFIIYEFDNPNYFDVRRPFLAPRMSFQNLRNIKNIVKLISQSKW